MSECDSSDQAVSVVIVVVVVVGVNFLVFRLLLSNRVTDLLQIWLNCHYCILCGVGLVVSVSAYNMVHW